MIEPRRWTLTELERDSEEAESIFREERLKESLSQYSEFFEQFSTVFRDLVDRLTRLDAVAPSSNVPGPPSGVLTGVTTALHRRQQPADAVAVDIPLEAAGVEGRSPRGFGGRSAVDPQEPQGPAATAAGEVAQRGPGLLRSRVAAERGEGPDALAAGFEV